MFRKLVAVLIVLPSIALAEPESKVALASIPFNEVLRDAAQISGARLVGLTSVGVNNSALRVSAVIPSDWKGLQVCLKIVSADGLYESSNAYDIAADWTGGEVELSYPSAAPKEVSAIPGTLISGILLKGDCSNGSKEAALVFWGSGEVGEVRVLLNTARADETYLTFPDHPDIEDILCDPIESDARNAFDMACVIPTTLTEIDPLSAVALSFKNGEMGQEENIVLRLGKGQ